MKITVTILEQNEQHQQKPSPLPETISEMNVLIETINMYNANQIERTLSRINDKYINITKSSFADIITK